MSNTMYVRGLKKKFYYNRGFNFFGTFQGKYIVLSNFTCCAEKMRLQYESKNLTLK